MTMKAKPFANLRLATIFARRELRGGLSGFRVFLACLTLGVAAIAAVGSVTEAFRQGLKDQSQAILGGDVEILMTQRAATKDELAWLNNQGFVSAVREMRSMGRGLESDMRGLIDVKAPDIFYPLFGRVLLEGGGNLHDALVQQDGIWGAVVEPKALPRMGVRVGDLVKVGVLDVQIRAVTAREPDRVNNQGFLFSPRVFLAKEALDQAGLIQAGSRVVYKYRLRLPEGDDADKFKQQAENRFPANPWLIRSPAENAFRADAFIERVGLFLTMVALTALLVGGVGVGNAVRAYLDRKTEIIATFKCLGTPGALIFETYLAQVLILAAAGIAMGLALGAATPVIVNGFIGDRLPIEVRTAIHPIPLAVAAIYGFLTTLAFAIWPLARAREVPAGSLFRDIVAPMRPWPRRSYVTGTIGAFAGLCAMAIGLTPYRLFAVYFLIGVASIFLFLRLEAFGLMRLAKAAGRPKYPGLRLALSNLYRPGTPTAGVVVSLGLGLTLLVGVSLVNGNFARQVNDEVPSRAPSLFGLDIRRDQVEAFDDFFAGIPGATEYQRFPMIRGGIVKINGTPSGDARVDADQRWVVARERNLTYRRDIPPGTRVVEGRWWPADYNGPPLLSIGQEIARGLGLNIGDTMTFNIVGQEITAEIANFRYIEWTEGGANFAIIFAPGALENAPQQNMVTVKLPPEVENDVHEAVTDAFPNVTIIWVRDALEAINELLSDLVMAVRAATSVTLLAGVLVLAGAMASGHRHRVYDAVVMKVLGATRRRVLAAYVMEYAILGLGTALVSAVTGSIAAYLIVTRMMEAEWYWLPVTLGSTVTGATVATVALGLFGTWRVLGQKAAPILRSE